MSQISNTFADIIRAELAGKGVFARGISRFKTKARPLIHRLSYPAAGQAQFVFFNAANADHVTTFNQDGTLGQDVCFLATHLRLRVLSGVDITGARVAGGAQSVANSSAPFTVAEELRTIGAMGDISLTVDRDEIFRAIGLDSCPWGGGSFINGAAATTNTTTNNALANVSNGDPSFVNRRVIGSPNQGWLIEGNQKLALTVKFATALSLTGGGIIEAAVDGYEFTMPK